MSTSALELRAADPIRRETPVAAEALWSWGGALALLVLAVWLVPIKNYRLPVNLPFSLEVYRLLIILYVFAWVVAVAAGTLRVDAGGLGKPVALLIGVGILSLLSNAGA
ncbi:MAG: hypothetical protein ABUL57_03095, partial [Chloroflexota bacterium]